MRFTITLEGADRLSLDVERACWSASADPENPGERARREFNGPSVREGLLAGYTRGEIKWAKQKIGVMLTDQLDLVDCRLLYYVLGIRRTDHKLLPIERFDDLALDDFALSKHVVTFLDQDGDCGECTLRVSNRAVHIDADPAADELPPTTAPDGPATTGTATE
jgi:hypothetical protein